MDRDSLFIKIYSTLVMLAIFAVLCGPAMACVNWLFGDGFTIDRFNLAFTGGFVVAKLADIWLDRGTKG